MAQDKNKDNDLGQQGNQNWDDKNDKRTSGSNEPNPERFEDANLGQGNNQGSDKESENRPDSDQESNRKHHGSGFNEDQTATGYGSSQRSERENVGPLDADLADLPSEKRLDRSNQTGPGLG
jgi:hypothetical protein